MNYTAFMNRNLSTALVLPLSLREVEDSLTRCASQPFAWHHLSAWRILLDEAHYSSCIAFDRVNAALKKDILKHEFQCSWAAEPFAPEVVAHFRPKNASSAYQYYDNLLRPLLIPETTTSPPDKIENLKQEVEDLKRQVAVLTGLVQLRDKTGSNSQSLETTPAQDPLAAAKARGAAYMKTEFENPENLTLIAASKYAGRSDRVINQERNRGWLYALILEGNQRGYRYPKWQFDVSASRLRAVLELLIPSELGCWAIHSFLKRPHSSLDNISPSEAIGDSNIPLERVLDIVRTRLDPHQGAA